MDKKLFDTKDSKFVLEGSKEEQKLYEKKIKDNIEELRKDRSERQSVYSKRRDFYTGNHGSYSNITGIIKDTKQKKGHTNQVINYAGKTVVKMAMGLANNPPTLMCVPEDPDSDVSKVNSQAVQDFIDQTFNDRINRFWKKTYRRTVFNQATLGDAIIRTFPDVVKKKIIITTHDDMSNVMVGWNNREPGSYDFVITEQYVTVQFLEEEYGIKVDKMQIPKVKESNDSGTGSWYHNDNWGMNQLKTGSTSLPTGKNDLAKLKFTEYDCDDAYAILIENELVQLIMKDDISFPKIKFITIVQNIPNPPSNWSIADIDYLIDAQIELNDNNNRSSDYIRVGGVQRYVAYNLNGFDPESLKTSSGQVIFVNSSDGTSRFEPLPTNINSFPSDQYNQRIMGQMYDLGLPKVNYGASGADSGRSKAIDYQSSIDLTVFKRDAWELALSDICDKIQIFGHFLFPELQFFYDEMGEFIVRNMEYDWSDILPVSQSDKIVNVANKYNMVGIPLEQAYKELGYRNPKQMVADLKKELQDPDLMILRSKSFQLSQGLLEAQNTASTMAQSNVSETAPAGGGTPTLTSEQNDGAKPMASQSGSSFSSPQGFISRTRQNLQAQGK